MSQRITRVAGPAVQASDMAGSFMGEVVKLGAMGLIGEVIRIEGEIATIQVYEDTTGLIPGDRVERSGEEFSVELGPGLLGSIFDGVQRPLQALASGWGDFISKGAQIPRLDRSAKWEFRPKVAPGQMVAGGAELGHVPETELVNHKIMVPHGVSGEVAKVFAGPKTITDPVAELADGTLLYMRQKWNIRKPRPVGKRLPSTRPLVTGQRVIDSLFPIALGGVGIIPGGFGSGKTVLEQTIAKHSEARIIIYIGCGERGNEMADTVEQLLELSDPATGRPLMERTILIANTSNMPVAAREASIYTGVTIAEYYRDMGYDVVALADSSSRWAEALREISSRMEEIPGEEGYPPYLSGRLGAFYERAGKVAAAGRPEETGSLTIIGAVSPPGGDFSEPVTQASLRMASTFWGLDTQLAYQRHFPAINWRTSYSLTHRAMTRWFTENVGDRWPEMIAKTQAILQREEELEEIARIVGADSMEERERTALEAGRIIREGYLRQSAVHPVDVSCPLSRQLKTLETILGFIAAMNAAVGRGAMLEDIITSPLVERLLRLKEAPPEGLDALIESLREEYKTFFDSLEDK
ncbi:MAG: V-type ATP synthase subunit A [Nitrospinota bacterium]|nr:V-type ATP synthase subunit A [Nitrospinota bacterium]